jgi:hypothetical protein
MKKQLLNRKKLIQLVLSLFLILVSANLSWGQTPITVPNADFSSGSTLSGSSPWTIPGWTITQNAGTGNANLTVASSGVISGSFTCTGANATSGANPNANQAALIIESDKINISSYAGTTSAFTYAFQIKVATATASNAPWNVIVKVYDEFNAEVLSAVSQTKVQPSLRSSVTPAGTYVNASAVGTLLGAASASVKYITIQVHLGQMLANTPTLDDFTLTAAGAAASTTLTPPASTALSYEIGNGPSAEQSFQVAGANLGSNNITVTPGTNIEISSTSGSGFGSSPITLTQSSGTVATTTLYARLISGLALGSGGSNGARTVTVAATGTSNKTIQFTAAVNGINTTTITGGDLSYIAGSGGPSAEGSFTVTTNGLTNDLVVTPGSDLEISIISGTDFGSTAITLANTITSQVIYSRLKAGLSAGSYNGASTAVVVSSTGFTNVTKQFTGTITDPPTTWNGTSWSNTSGPTTSIDAIIDGNFSTTASGVTAGFTAKTLTVNATRSFTINSGHNITVDGAITNNGTITIENNANLVQTATGLDTNSGSGTAIVKRNSASIYLYDYTLWSSPVAGQNLRTFSNNTLANRFYTYNSTFNQYNAVDFSSPVNFAPATGYLIRAPNTWAAATPNTFNGVFTGVPNNGNISLSASALASNKFYAVGNPYPSTISADLFLNGNATGGTLYFWRKINNATTTPTTSYATYTLAGGVGTGTPNSGGSSSITPDGTIQVGQGFIVKTGASSTALNFTNAMRTSSNTSPFLRTTEERSRFWLNLTSTTGAFCQTMVAYMPEATSGVDNAIDGRYFNDSPVALTSIINNEEYTIQGRALPFAKLDTVPLGFKTNAAGNYTIAIDHVDGLFSSGQAIYLKDNLLNTVNNLSAGSYSFASAIGTFNSRFEVVYQSTLAETNPTFTANSVIAFSENGEIRINSGSTIMELVRMYDLQGRLLVEKKQINSSETKLSTTATNQVLLLEITAANGTKVTKKIIQ